ncbi:AAA family ATPase [Sphingobacterium faecale]|uniref:AAA family ATPase n=1 Tax=Sphingobacterium faecale TaxID=2803775 RepID=A0ABS1QZF6_9SPHI|nr:ATP-binding protein [Sphingobacterium faecale]MBL1407167.1 AAA family ATPase [Sphingobacterium faecale]
MNITDLLITKKENIVLEDMILSEESRIQLDHLLKEHRYLDVLQNYGLPVNNKILLYGASGCGKTSTAKALANALNKPIYILNLSNVISAKIGETSQHLKQIFDKAGRDQAVLFLDEFDQIGKSRMSEDKDVGEIRRLVNTLIQLIDYYPEKALLICATNHMEVIDQAILRRFQLQIEYTLPSAVVLDGYYDSLLAKLPEQIAENVKRKYGISFAEAKDCAFTQAKYNIIKQLENGEIILQKEVLET